MVKIIADQLPVAIFIGVFVAPFAPAINFLGEKLLNWQFNSENSFLAWLMVMAVAIVLMAIAEWPRPRKG